MSHRVPSSVVPLLLLCLFATAAFTPASAQPTLADGIAIVANPVTLERNVDTSSTTYFELSVVMLEMQSPFRDLSSIQFGVNVDPGIQILNATTTGLMLEPAPGEYVLSFPGCLQVNNSPTELMKLLISVTDVSITDARVELRGVDSKGEGMIGTRCATELRFLPVNFGGVIVNPSSPQIAGFATSPATVVEGHDYELGWATTAGGTATLDGTSVTSDGTQVYTAPGAITHTLTLAPGGATSSLAVDIIREPRVNRFLASLFDVDGSPFVRLEWDAEGTDHVTIDGNVGTQPSHGSTAIPFVQPTSFLLEASNEWGLTSAVATVGNINGPPAIIEFSAAPTTFAPGEMVTLRYSTVGATSITIEPDIGAVVDGSGVIELQPTAATTWTLTASNADGTSTAQTSTQPGPPKFLTFSAAPTILAIGQNTHLNWEVLGADEIELLPEATLLPGTATSADYLAVDGLAQIIVAARNAYGETRRSVDTTVTSAILGFSVSPDPVFRNQPYTINWSLADGVTGEIQPDIGPVAGQVGGVTFNANDFLQKQYTMTATSGTWVEEDTVLVQVRDFDIPLQFVVSNTQPFGGDDILVTWSADNADSVLLEPLGSLLDPAGGTTSIPIDSPVTLQLTAWNWTETATASVDINPVAPSVNLTVDKSTAWPGDTVILTVQVNGSQTTTLEPGFGTIAGYGNYSTQVFADTQFILSATNTVGTSLDTVNVTLAAPQVEQFSFTPSTLITGESSTLAWSVNGADTVEIFDPNDVPQGISANTGSLVIQDPLPGTWRLQATNQVGTSVAYATVEVGSFAIRSFYAFPSTIATGDSSLLNWEVEGTATVELVGFGPQPLTGTQSVLPFETTTYQLIATNGTEQKSAFVTVLVGGGANDPPILELSASPTQSVDYATVFQNPGGNFFDVYMRIEEFYGALSAYEARFDLPAGAFVIEREFIDIPRALELGGDTNMIVATVDCIIGNNLDITLMRYKILDTQLRNYQTLELNGSIPSSYPGGIPGWVDCQAIKRGFRVRQGFAWGDGIIVPVAVLPMEVEWQTDGLRLHWEDDALGNLRSVRVLRGSSPEGLLQIAEIDDPSTLSRASWTDQSARTAFASGPLYYQLVAESIDGRSFQSSATRVQQAPPAFGALRTRLLPNIPNPFNPRTTIRFELARDADVRLGIYDLAGRKVRDWFLPARPRGSGQVVWDGIDQRGRTVGTGVYIVRLDADGTMDTWRMTLLK